jgi:hypothetical protein
MSSPPQRSETREIELSREERWVVHHVLSKRVDDAIDGDTVPPEWVLEVVETIEADEETLTVQQAHNLHDTVTAYAEDSDAPREDLPHATAVIDRLESVLE